MKTYEVNIEAYRTIIVEANSEEEAMEVAEDLTSRGDFEHEQTTAREISGKEMEIQKRCFKFIPAPK